jgi:uncharacterized protein (TIGR02266 family)
LAGSSLGCGQVGAHGHLGTRFLKSRARAADPRWVAGNVEASPGADRRASVRADVKVEVGLTTDTNFYTGLAQDISAGGVFVATHQLRRHGEKVVLQFSLPGVAAVFLVDAEVRWIREVTSLTGGRQGATGMGLKFLNLSAHARKAIATFLEQRDSIFYDDE